MRCGEIAAIPRSHAATSLMRKVRGVVETHSGHVLALRVSQCSVYSAVVLGVECTLRYPRTTSRDEERRLGSGVELVEEG